MNAKDRGLMTAFHHMQRASSVMSLVEKGKGKDLRKLLDQGVKLYRQAMEDESQTQFVLGAIGVLRAAEHLSFAGLYRREGTHRPTRGVAYARVAGRVMAADRVTGWGSLKVQNGKKAAIFIRRRWRCCGCHRIRRLTLIWLLSWPWRRMRFASRWRMGL